MGPPSLRTAPRRSTKPVGTSPERDMLAFDGQLRQSQVTVDAPSHMVGTQERKHGGLWAPVGFQKSGLNVI